MRSRRTYVRLLRASSLKESSHIMPTGSFLGVATCGKGAYSPLVRLLYAFSRPDRRLGVDDKSQVHDDTAWPLTHSKDGCGGWSTHHAEIRNNYGVARTSMAHLNKSCQLPVTKREAWPTGHVALLGAKMRKRFAQLEELVRRSR